MRGLDALPLVRLSAAVVIAAGLAFVMGRDGDDQAEPDGIVIPRVTEASEGRANEPVLALPAPGGVRIDAPLTPQSDHPSAPSRRAVRSAISEADRTQAQVECARLVNDACRIDDPSIAQSAIQSITTMLEDADASTAVGALRGLTALSGEQLGDGPIREAVDRLVLDPRPDVALEALAVVVSKRLRDVDPHDVLHVARQAPESSLPAAIWVLVRSARARLDRPSAQFVADSILKLRGTRYLRDALAYLGGVEVTPMLDHLFEELLLDPRDVVRKRAMEHAIRRSRGWGSSVGRLLVKIFVESGDEESQMAFRCLSAARALSSPTQSDVANALGARSAQLRDTNRARHFIRLLRYFGRPEHARVLIDLGRNPLLPAGIRQKARAAADELQSRDG